MKQKDLFNETVKEDWEKEWKDMPEFVQEDKSAYQQLIVTFKCKEDLDKFSRLINQNITNKTKSLNFPKDDRLKPSNFLYTFEEKKQNDN